MCDIFIQNIYPPNYLCTSRRCSSNFIFSQDIYPDIRAVFVLAFCASRGHVLHFYMCVTYLFWMLTHQSIHVHPADALEILHFSRTFTWTPGLFFFQVFHWSLEYVLYFYMCITYLFRTFTHKIICVHPADTLKILHFPGPFSSTPGLFFSSFLHFSWDNHLDTRVVFFIFSCFQHILGYVLHFYMGVSYLFRTSTHQIICVLCFIRKLATLTHRCS